LIKEKESADDENFAYESLIFADSYAKECQFFEVCQGFINGPKITMATLGRP